MREWFEPSHTVIVEGIDQHVDENFGSQKQDPFFQADIIRTMESFRGNGKKKTDQDGKKNRMGKRPVGDELLRRAHPESGDEIYIRNTLCQGTPKKGLFAELPVSKKFTYAGTQRDMR